MNPQSEAAIRTAEALRAQAVARNGQPRAIAALGGEFVAPDMRPLGRKSQLTVPAAVRRRWTTRGSDEVLSLAGVRLGFATLLLLPYFRANAWMENHQDTHSRFRIAMQENGNFEIPKEMRDAWAGGSLVRFDLGYCYAVVPHEEAESFLYELWGSRGN